MIASEENDFGQGITDWAPPQGLWWLTDPLDGTTNYSRGLPHFCVTVAVLEGWEPIGGAIFDPLRNQMFAAVRGGGATLDGQPLRTSERADPADAVLEAGLARGVAPRRQSLAIFNTLATECRTVRTAGAAALALAYVAAGWLEAYIHLTLRPWDCAAGVLMIREAGGAVSRPDGGPERCATPRFSPATRRLRPAGGDHAAGAGWGGGVGSRCASGGWCGWWCCWRWPVGRSRRLGRGLGQFVLLEWQPGGELIAVGGIGDVWIYDSDLRQVGHLSNDLTLLSIAWSPMGESWGCLVH